MRGPAGGRCVFTSSGAPTVMTSKDGSHPIHSGAGGRSQMLLLRCQTSFGRLPGSITSALSASASGSQC